MDKGAARIHAVELCSRANGPGHRFVVWLQGCTLGCPGCFNPATHPVEDSPGSAVSALSAVVSRMNDAPASVAGLTLSGGEPMEQPEAALELLRAARARGWSTLMFSGFTRAELEALPLGLAVLAELDVLVDGRYIANQRLGTGLRGSANQVVHLLTARYRQADIDDVPTGEIRIAPDGTMVFTGVAPLRLRR